MKKTLMFSSLLFCFVTAFTQSMKQSTYTSAYQVDKTLSGKKVFNSNIVNITFTDPKSVTNPKSTNFDNLPVGELIIMYRNLKTPIIYRIKYFGLYGGDKDQDWYGISETLDDYNCLILKKNKNPSPESKEYKYILITVNMDPDSKNWITYTAYYCNLN